MRTAVCKYGGSSLATTGQVRAAAGQVARIHRSGYHTVVVVSARGDTTDDLLRLAREVGGGGLSRELDQLLATGECASAAVFAIAVRALGVPAVSLTGPQAGVRGVGEPGAGRVAAVRPHRVRRLLSEGNVVVVAGFQGLTATGDVITLGRGGSDTTAVALAAALGAPRCDTFTDVDAIRTADPRVVDDTRPLPEIGTATMVELAVAGARVLHPPAVALAARYGVELGVGHSGSGAVGSVVRGDLDGTDGRVVAVAHDLDLARVLIQAVPDAGRDPRAAVLDVLARHPVAVDFVSHSGPDNPVFRMGFTVRRSDLDAIREPLERAVAALDGRVRVDANVGSVSLVSGGSLHQPDWASRMSNALSAAGIAPIWVAVSPLRVSVGTPLDRVPDAVRLLHREFGLDRAADPDQPADTLAVRS